jgi:hypothetical protein
MPEIDAQFFLEIDRESDVIHMDDAPVVDHHTNSSAVSCMKRIANLTSKKD